MSEKIYNTLLLSQDSPLDAHSREVIQNVYDAEWARSQDLPTDDPLDPKEWCGLSTPGTRCGTRKKQSRRHWSLRRKQLQKPRIYFGHLDLDHILYDRLRGFRLHP